MADIEKIQELGDVRMTRRRALQAGAAAGVTAAVVAGPQIGRLGSAPAYAQTCSQGLTCTSTPKESVNQGGGNCGPAIAFNNADAFSGNGITATPTGECFDGVDGVNVTTTLDLCTVNVTFFAQSAPDTPINSTTVGPVDTSSGGAFIAYPNLPDGSVPSGKAVITVCCSDEPSCF